MVNTTITLILVMIVFSVWVAAAARTKLHSINGKEGQFASSPPTKDGICKTLVEPQGYICHEHTVTTKDGYILSLQRMPTTHSGQPAKNPPVLLQHGLLLDGVTWLLNSPEESLAFILADNGYDVWIANTRGTKYSKKHESLTPIDQAYWEWSWDELMAYDLTAFVQFVYNNTGNKLHYVGHSLGTLMALASFSKNKLLDKIRSAALLCPIAHLGHMTSPVGRTATSLAEEWYWLGLREFSPRKFFHEFLETIKSHSENIHHACEDAGELAAELLELFCSQPGNDCSDLLIYVSGKNCCLNSSRFDALLQNEPQSTATKNIIHLAQMTRTGTIAMYDYGVVENINHYGQITPPVYNMTSILNDFPLFLSYGGEDSLSDVDDVKLLLQNLKNHNPKKLVVQYIEDYAHFDFVFGINANQVVYDPMMAFFSWN